jgi:predicted transcriptional regulator
MINSEPGKQLQAEEPEAKLTALDSVIARGLADADAGRTKPAEEIIGRLEHKYSAMALAKAASEAKSPSSRRRS